MKISTAMRLAIRTLLLCTLVAMPTAASAAELSPWLGSDDQTPFQLDPNTMIAVTFAADPLHTGTLASATCLPDSCEIMSKAATRPTSTSSAPKY
jgi:hypothetical protein